MAANYDQFVSTDSTPNLLTDNNGFSRRILTHGGGLAGVSRLVAGYAASEPGGAYLALTADQAISAQALGLAPSTTLTNLARALSRSPEWQLFYRNRDAVIYRFLGAPRSGTGRPPLFAAHPSAATPPPGPSSDPAAVGIGIGGLALVGLVLARNRRVKLTQQEETMDTTQSPNRVATLAAAGKVANPEPDRLEPEASLTAVAPIRPTAATADELTALLADRSPAVRLRGLAHLEVSPTNVVLLLGLLNDDLAAEVRAGAVRVLATASRTDRRQALAVALADLSPVVRVTAVEVLVATEPTDLELLIAASRDADAGVRQAAFAAWRRSTPGPSGEW